MMWAGVHSDGPMATVLSVVTSYADRCVCSAYQGLPRSGRRKSVGSPLGRLRHFVDVAVIDLGEFVARIGSMVETIDLLRCFVRRGGVVTAIFECLFVISDTFLMPFVHSARWNIGGRE